MKEVILNDECAHCKDKECHDGYNFCNQAMKKNSFYKNAKLYKGLEVIQRPTYEELKKENAELKKRVENQKSFLERIRAKFELGEIERKEIEGYLESDQLTKAREIILRLYNAGRDVLMCRAEEKAYDNLSNAINDKSIEQFLNSEEEK